jgi:outer membrane lipase/esterase
MHALDRTAGVFIFVLSLALSLLLAGCGGGSSSTSNNANAGSSGKPQFSAVVSFGDSLSDVGSYASATVDPQTGVATGGHFTTNPGAIWVEDISATLGLTISPNVTGFGEVQTSCPLPHCTGYGQGGSRITDPNGVGHGSGELTIPLVTQMDNFLATNASYKPTDIVFVYGGSNDVFVQAAIVSAVAGAASAQPGATPESIAAAVSQAQQAAGIAIAQAATELAGYVRNKILAKGAVYVALMNLPDSATTPYGATLSPSGRALLTYLVTTFNATLQKAVSDQALNVLVIDANDAVKLVLANPVQYGVTNSTVPACDLSKLPGESSLFCNQTTLIASANNNFLFADGVHPSAYGHKLFADYVALQMAKKGWL